MMHKFYTYLGNLKIGNNIVHIFLFFIFIFTNISQSTAQETFEDNDELILTDSPEVKAEGQIAVFMDCRSCDDNFIRQQLNFVNYVRDQQLAQVHVFITEQSTGSGGTQYTISFIGKKDFLGINNTLTYASGQTNTPDEIRHGLNSIIKLGLVPYIAHTPMAGQLVVTLNNFDVEQVLVVDPWNNWIFEVYGGMNFEKETSVSSLNIRYGLFADHVTEDWRIRIRPYFNYNQRKFIKGEQVIKSVLHRNGFEGRVVRSLTNHWSAGIFTDIISTTYENIDLGYSISPAIEYSLLPYKEALTKEITLAYTVGYIQRKYIEETIYGQNSESLMNQALKFRVRIRQPWGSVSAQLEGSHFLHDIQKNRLSFESNVSVRVFKGLSVHFSNDLGIMRDQLSLPKGGASLEDILLKQRQLATSYGISFSVGLSYSFGSIYNNVVNTRL